MCPSGCAKILIALYSSKPNQIFHIDSKKKWWTYGKNYLLLLLFGDLMVINYIILSIWMNKPQKLQITENMCHSWQQNGLPSGYYVKEQSFHHLSM